MACLNWNDVNHLTAESCVVVLDFNVGVGSKEAKAGRSGILLLGQQMTLVTAFLKIHNRMFAL